MDTAKEMIKESLPIKCLEAVILGMYPFSFGSFSPSSNLKAKVCVQSVQEVHINKAF